MAGRGTKFTEADRARVFVSLTANDGLVKRTARDTGIPETTVRRWKTDWEKNGPPDTSELAEAIDTFVEEADTVKLEALREIRKRIPESKTTVSALIAVVGVLDDKTARVKGIGQSSKVEHKLVLPSAQEARELMQGFLEAGAEAARRRDEEIVDAEFVEQAPQGALPAARR